jgi:hypothetical protein
MALARLLRRLVAPARLHRSCLTAAVLAGLARGEVAGKRAAEDVPLGILAGIEAWECHEQDEDHGTRERERQVMAQNAEKDTALEAGRHRHQATAAAGLIASSAEANFAVHVPWRRIIGADDSRPRGRG